MTNDIREKAEALVGLIDGGVFQRRIHRDYDKGFNDGLETIMETKEFEDLKTALRPSRQEIADYLTNYNKWRRGGDNEMPEPKELGYYIDCAIEELKK